MTDQCRLRYTPSYKSKSYFPLLFQYINIKEEVNFAKGGVATSNFDDYPIIRMSEVPDIEVHIVKSTDKIGGIGELGIPALAPAVANAFFNATGVRIRRIPLTPKVVLEALKKT